MTVTEVPEARFPFGANWRDYLAVLNEDRIREAERSLTELLGPLNGLRFLDIGCGSGLFSLVACRLGATVHSFDFDPESVGCAQELRERYRPDAEWTIDRASVLDRGYLLSLGQFDVVYAWGVLHHTGDMWTALDNASTPVKPGGRLHIALYNDRGIRTDCWRVVKRTYQRLPAFLRAPYVALAMAPFELRSIFGALLRLKPRQYLRLWSKHKHKRGMSRWHDMVDWVGGYPFETAKPGDVIAFYGKREFEVVSLLTRPGQNEFVFAKRPNPAKL